MSSMLVLVLLALMSACAGCAVAAAVARYALGAGFSAGCAVFILFTLVFLR